MLLAKTLRSSTFKQALIAIGTFGMIVSALFVYVYLSTSSYVRSRSDRGIMTEYASLRDVYERSGRDGLIAKIQQRIADVVPVSAPDGTCPSAAASSWSSTGASASEAASKNWVQFS